ncbi:type I secretion system permease/ATPase [Acidimangrovimonas sediminis]|uniref:type I secretion system permease/ATPase n=1 Tax=Acidimangrovimonas sediminis TaxID=2056283 RepID=UPI0038BD3679
MAKLNTRPGLDELRAARDRGRGLVVTAFVFSLFVNLLMLTGSLFMLQVYDRVLASRSMETLTALFLLVSGLFLLMGVIDYARGRIMARVGARFQTALDRRVFEATMRRSQIPQERGLPANALRDVDAVQALLGSPLLLALMDLPWTPFFIAAIFIFHPLQGVTALAGAIVLVTLAVVNQLTTARKVKAAQGLSTQAQFFAEQVRTGAEVVMTQGMRAAMLRRWQELRVEAMRQSLAASDRTGSFTSATRAFRLYLQSAMLAVGAYLVLKNQITAGAMVAASIMLGRALAPVEQAVGQWPVLQKARAAWVSLGRYLAATPERPAQTRLPVPVPRLEVRNLSICAPGTRTALVRNLTFTVEPGQALGVIGASGTGKSTLARALLGYWPAASGEIRLGGATLDQYEPDDLGRHIGYLPQQVALFGGTVAENIARMETRPDAEAVIEAARRAHAHEMILALPEGYGTRLDGTDSRLSGGQRQRIGLARALYGGPRLLLLDEPNSALDTDGSEALTQAVERAKADGMAVIIMTHRPQAIEACERLMVMEAGHLRAIGPRDEVLARVTQNGAPVTAMLQAAAARRREGA